MERKKLIRIAIIILVIIIGVIIFENSIKGIGNLIDKNKEQANQKEQLEKYQNSEEYKETVMLEEVVSDIVKLFNDNNIDEIYNLIDVDYRDYKFENDKELFKEYIKSYINNTSKITLQTYEKINGRYVCRMLAESNGNLKSFVALIRKQNDSYNLIFDDITSINKENKQVETNEIKCDIIYNVTAKKTLIYTLEFTNLTKKDINYTYDSVMLKDSFGNIFKANIKETKILLKSGEKVRQNIVFYDNIIHKFPKTYLDFNFVKENNQKINVNMYIESIM